MKEIRPKFLDALRAQDVNIPIWVESGRGPNKYCPVILRHGLDNFVVRHSVVYKVDIGIRLEFVTGTRCPLAAPACEPG